MGLLSLLVICSLVPGVQSAEILAMYADQIFSHMYSMLPYLERWLLLFSSFNMHNSFSLASAGHHVTVFHTGSLPPPKLKHANISQLELRRVSDDTPSSVEALLKVFWDITSHSFEPPMLTMMNDAVLRTEVDDYSQEVSRFMINSASHGVDCQPYATKMGPDRCRHAVQQPRLRYGQLP